MFKESIFSICCLTAIHLTASENEFSDKISQNANRYQMKVVAIGDSRDTEIYVFDKETGTIWRTMQDVRGKSVSYHPWVQLPPLPIQ